MDENLQELENELRRLAPRAPSVRLRAALERDLDDSVRDTRMCDRATSSRPWKWATWPLAGVGALAAVALMVLSVPELPETARGVPPVATTPSARVPDGIEGATELADRYEPVRASSILYDLQEGAPATLPDRTEGREVRYRYVDTYTWKNPATNASLRWSVPRDEVRLVRANLD